MDSTSSYIIVTATIELFKSIKHFLALFSHNCLAEHPKTLIGKKHLTKRYVCVSLSFSRITNKIPMFIFFEKLPFLLEWCLFVMKLVATYSQRKYLQNDV